MNSLFRAGRFSLAAACVVALASAAGAQVTVVAQHATTFATRADVPASSGRVNLDRAANRITLGPGAHLTVLAGPKRNMMSFEIEGLLNPELVLPAGGTVTLTVVNIDDDMRHDLVITRLAPPYSATPSPGAGSAGTPLLRPHANDRASLAASVLEVRAARAGTGYYICTARGHAKAGMFGKLSIQR